MVSVAKLEVGNDDRDFCRSDDQDEEDCKEESKEVIE